MTDFEGALRKPINICYRGVRLQGCWFHYDRAIYRYCQKRPLLRSFLKMNSDAKEIFKEMLCLPLLPQDQFYEGYRAIVQKARDRRVYGRMFALFRYFNTYWMREVLFQKTVLWTDGQMTDRQADNTTRKN